LVLILTEGTVKWFNNRKGYGFIATEEEGDIFVHHSAIVKEGDEFATLHENDKVEFEVTQGDKGPAASKVVVTEAAPPQVRDFRY
jgi:CspA family cold shock protein